MSLSQATPATDFLKFALANVFERLEYRGHAFTDACVGASSAAANFLLLAGAANQLRAFTTSSYSAVASPFAGGTLAACATIFDTATTLKTILAGSQGLAVALTTNPITTGWSVKVTPGGYRFNRVADNNHMNAPDVSQLGYPYVICAVGDNGATGAGTGRLVRSTDNGATWTDIALPACRELIGICALQGQTWIATPAVGAALFSVDNGATWITYGVPNTPKNANAADYGRTVITNGLFLAFNSDTNQLIQSTDGSYWTAAQGVNDFGPPNFNLFVRPRDAVSIGRGAMILMARLPNATTGLAGTRLFFSQDGGNSWINFLPFNTLGGAFDAMAPATPRNTLTSPSYLQQLLILGKESAAATTGLILGPMSTFPLS